MKKLVFVAISFLMCVSTTFSQDFIIEGKWKYSFEDKREFSKPEFDDSNWTELDKLFWRFNTKETANRTLWIRKTVVIPSSLKAGFEKTGALTLSMGKIQQSDQTYLNGKSIGFTGSGDSYRNYLVKMDDVLWDKENTIASRVGHWGVFSMSKVPALVTALPEHFFVYRAGLKNADAKGPVFKKDLTYQLNITNKSIKAPTGILKADFYNFAGTKIYSTQKNVTLAIGENAIDFPYNSPSVFLKIVYSLSIPDYNYTGEWNGEFGYDNIVYRSVTPVVPYKVVQNYVPAAMNKLQIGGWLGERLKANTEQRLYKVDEEGLLAGFINRPGAHSWIGEHIGKFLEAACNSYANNSDPALKIQIDRSAQQLMAAQLSDGYLGTYEMDSHWTSWDVWSHRYDLMGLLRYYELSGFKPALKTSEKIGDLLIQTFGNEPEKKDIIKAGGHVGMAATCAIESMIELYRFTGEKKYLDFCYYIIKSYDTPGGPAIISSLNTVGRVDKVANAKAYEMMSNFLGIIKLYRLTNDEQFLNPLVTAWNDIVSKRLYITGTTSSFEHFQDDHILPAENESHMGEGCVTTTWTQFNYQLFSITGQIKYLDEIERTIYNHLTGAENPRTGGVSYYTALNGVKPHRTDITCCMSSVPRAIAMIPFFAGGKINHAPAILLYQPGVFKTSLENKAKTAVEFKTVGDYLVDGKTTILINPSATAKFKVLFRKPYWAENYTITVNKVKQAVGTNLIAIDRVWKKGDKVEVTFNMPIKVLDGGISYPGKIAIQRGPQVLSFDQKLNKVDAKNVKLNANSIQLEVAPTSVLPIGWVGTDAYQVNADVNGVQEKIIIVPYADASQTGGSITTWFQKKI